jgi:AcrR family transcriptional regulator
MGKRRMTGPERREQLLGVAREVFAEKGYEATSVETIAERAGVSKPVVYEHFGGKEGLYAVIVDREVTELTARMADAMRAVSPREAGEHAAMAFLGYIEEHQEGFRILVHDAPSGMGSGSLGSVISDVAARVEELLLATFKDRGFDRSTVPMYARMLVGAVALVGEWWLEAGKPAREQVAAHVVNLMWNGLKDLQPRPDLRTVTRD